uniref:C2H2-type domain-containing protein n=1 Tax=Populus trichocarpa TaxID=3694 RepID=A0A3N7FWN9_POPTR
MAGNREVGFPKTTASSLREQLARTTLSRVRARGHPYLELREDGKRFIFFCTLCLSPCYSDTILLDHLRGNLHTERLSAAKATLLKPNPWPFSDGIHFFDASSGNEEQLAIKDGKESSRFLKFEENSDNLAIVKYVENLKPGCDTVVDENLSGSDEGSDLVIPSVRLKEEVSDLKATLVGSGQIAARMYEKKDGSNEISRIWCEWLGKKSSNDEDKVKVLDHDFGVVTFAYDYELGKSGLFDDVKLLLSSSAPALTENDERGNWKRKRSVSEPEDVSRSLTNQYGFMRGRIFKDNLCLF